MQPGDIITIEAGELVAGGEALARVDGFPVFASNVYPGDVARVQLYDVKKGFAKADLVELVTPSPWRRLAPCPIANECGGCDWTALRLDKQLQAKRRILSESLRRIGKFDVGALPAIHVHPSPLNYRLRSRLHRDGDAIGFYAVRSNRVVPLAKECEVVGVQTARLVPQSPHPAFGHPLPTAMKPPWGEGHSRNDLARMRIECPSPLVRGEGGRRPDEGLSSPQHEPKRPSPARDDILDDIWELGGALITGERDLTITVGTYTYRLNTRAFFQINRHLLGTMLRLVTSHASRVRNRSRAADLYGGVGFFTVPIARLFERVTMIEGSPVSARCARRNVPRNVKVIAASVEHAIRDMREVDFTLLDPPRAGASREVIEAVAEKTKEIIAYLSCDPVTFSRDASRLIASGWRLATLDLLDLFPNTHHVETLSSFERDS